MPTGYDLIQLELKISVMINIAKRTEKLWEEIRVTKIYIEKRFSKCQESEWLPEQVILTGRHYESLRQQEGSTATNHKLPTTSK